MRLIIPSHLLLLRLIIEFVLLSKNSFIKLLRYIGTSNPGSNFIHRVNAALKPMAGIFTLHAFKCAEPNYLWKNGRFGRKLCRVFHHVKHNRIMTTNNAFRIGGRGDDGCYSSTFGHTQEYTIHPV